MWSGEGLTECCKYDMRVSEILQEEWELTWPRSMEFAGSDQFLFITEPDDYVWQVHRLPYRDGWILSRPGGEIAAGKFATPDAAIRHAAGDHRWQIVSRDGRPIEFGQFRPAELTPAEIRARDRKAALVRQRKARSGITGGPISP
jgi:hypothetical protein